MLKLLNCGTNVLENMAQPASFSALLCSFIGDNVQVLEDTTLLVGHNRKTLKKTKKLEGLMLSLEWKYLMKIQTLKKVFIYIIVH